MNMSKVALIAGIRGQDGSYLADYLLKDDWQIIGITRGGGFSNNIAHLNGKIDLLTSDYSQNDILRLVQQNHPSVIFNLAGQTYVSKSWDILNETVQSAAIVPMYFLDAILHTSKDIRYFQASSSEIYQSKNDLPLTEKSLIGPTNPYGCSKVFSHYLVHAYRTQHGLHASIGILFNHESPRRADNFLSRKVIREAVKIKRGKLTSLVLGNLNIERDWGYAPDYVRAIAQLMELDNPEDINICTGVSRTVRELAEVVFNHLNISTDLINSDPKLFRTYEPMLVVGSNEKAKRLLKWSPQTSFEDMIQEMVEFEIRSTL